LSVYGRVSHHLIVARETALAHDCTSFTQRVAVEGMVLQIDALIAVVRKLHHTR
jgi:hypothetical protein